MRLQRHTAVAEHPGRAAGEHGCAARQGGPSVDFLGLLLPSTARRELLARRGAGTRTTPPDGFTVVGSALRPSTPSSTCRPTSRRASAGFGLTFPVALDNSYEHLERLRQPGPGFYGVPDRRDRADQARLHRRGRLPRRGAAHPAAAARRAPRHHPAEGDSDLPDTTPTDQDQSPETYLGAEREAVSLRRQHQLRPQAGQFTAPAALDAELLRPVWRLDDRPAGDHRGQGRRDRAGLPRLLDVCTPRRRRHRHDHRAPP